MVYKPTYRTISTRTGKREAGKGPVTAAVEVDYKPHGLQTRLLEDDH
jgi:hypothetical protein